MRHVTLFVVGLMAVSGAVMAQSWPHKSRQASGAVRAWRTTDIVARVMSEPGQSAGPKRHHREQDWWWWWLVPMKRPKLHPRIFAWYGHRFNYGGESGD